MPCWSSWSFLELTVTIVVLPVSRTPPESCFRWLALSPSFLLRPPSFTAPVPKTAILTGDAVGHQITPIVSFRIIERLPRLFATDRSTADYRLNIWKTVMDCFRGAEFYLTGSSLWHGRKKCRQRCKHLLSFPRGVCWRWVMWSKKKFVETATILSFQTVCNFLDQLLTDVNDWSVLHIHLRFLYPVMKIQVAPTPNNSLRKQRIVWRQSQSLVIILTWFAAVVFLFYSEEEKIKIWTMTPKRRKKKRKLMRYCGEMDTC